ncbi:caspase-3 [Linepithema humile]|uniref:caspase-3 n=1 Tax=Linepithema humile TaxID=83485 RepID=UPI0006230A3D|nr:PREDICTED: caspase-2 [Linepithema humile]
MCVLLFSCTRSRAIESYYAAVTYWCLSSVFCQKISVAKAIFVAVNVSLCSTFKMDQRDREKIDKCCEAVVSKIDMTKLMPNLLKYKVYNRDDVNIPRWNKNITAQETVKDIYLTIKTRGPNAFKNLILSLRQSGHGILADVLEGKDSKNDSTSLRQTNHEAAASSLEGKNNNLRQEDHFVNHSISDVFVINQSDEPLKIKLIKATEFLDREYDNVERYPMRSKPRGIILIITNIYYNSSDEKPRLSAKHDEDNLKELFEKMGFVVVTRQNLTGQEIKNTVKTFSKRDDLEKVDSCFVIITSHGTEDKENNTEIQGTDYNASGQANYEKILCTDVCDYFTVEACPQLARKPKIFIFQLCRGKRIQKAVAYSRIATDTCAFSNGKTDESNIDIPRIQTTRNYSDMLIVQSTLPGYVAHRDTVTGSWFIQILCKVFMNHAHKNHVQDLFSMIDAELDRLRTMHNECQTSCVESKGFNKHCYLNPGLFEKS